MKKSDEQGGEKVFGFSPAEWRRRHQKIKEIMQLRNIDCLIIVGCSAKNWAYAASHVYVAGQDATGLGDYAYVVFPLEGDPIQLLPSAGSGKMMVNQELPVPMTLDVIFKKGKGEGQRIKDFAWGIVHSMKELGMEKSTIGIADMRVMPAGVYMEVLRDLPQATFVSAGDILLEARRVKSAEELVYVQKAGACADKGAEAMIEAASCPDATLESIRRACRVGMLEAGAKAVDFASLYLASWEEKRGSVARPMPMPDRRLQKGDLILNEICPNYHGAFVQACYPISIGVEERDMPDSFKETFKLHRELYELARAELRPGTTVAEIERKLTKHASAYGNFEKVWALQVSEMGEDHYKLNYTELQPNMVYCNHPMALVARGEPGFSRGIMLGNALIVTEGEPEVTSRRSLEVAVA